MLVSDLIIRFQTKLSGKTTEEQSAPGSDSCRGPKRDEKGTKNHRITAPLAHYSTKFWIYAELGKLIQNFN